MKAFQSCSGPQTPGPPGPRHRAAAGPALHSAAGQPQGAGAGGRAAAACAPSWRPLPLQPFEGAGGGGGRLCGPAAFELAATAGLGSRAAGKALVQIFFVMIFFSGNFFHLVLVSGVSVPFATAVLATYRYSVVRYSYCTVQVRVCTVRYVPGTGTRYSTRYDTRYHSLVRGTRYRGNRVPGYDTRVLYP